MQSHQLLIIMLMLLLAGKSL